MSMLFKRIKDWATSITTFRTGDVIPVDGPDGTAKMSKDTLLELTAQNALVGNMAPEFDPTRTSENPYKAGESVVYEGKSYTFNTDHYGAWNAADVYESSLETFIRSLPIGCVDGNAVELTGQNLAIVNYVFEVDGASSLVISPSEIGWATDTVGGQSPVILSVDLIDGLVVTNVYKFFSSSSVDKKMYVKTSAPTKVRIQYRANTGTKVKFYVLDSKTAIGVVGVNNSVSLPLAGKNLSAVNAYVPVCNSDKIVVVPDHAPWATDTVGGSNPVVLQISAYNRNYNESILASYQITNVPKKLSLSLPSDTILLRFFFRANIGETVKFDICDISKIEYEESLLKNLENLSIANNIVHEFVGRGLTWSEFTFGVENVDCVYIRPYQSPWPVDSIGGQSPALMEVYSINSNGLETLLASCPNVAYIPNEVPIKRPSGCSKIKIKIRANNDAVVPFTISTSSLFETYILSREDSDSVYMNSYRRGVRRPQFIMFSDPHGTKYSFNQFANTCNSILCDVDFAICTGDICQDRPMTPGAYSAYNEMIDKISMPLLPVIGNHDVGSSWYVGAFATLSKVIENVMGPAVEKNFIPENAGGYYFKDFQDRQVRVIVLNCYETGGLYDEQSKWTRVEYNSSYPDIEFSHSYALGERVNLPGWTDYSYECNTPLTTPSGAPTEQSHDIPCWGIRRPDVVLYGHDQMQWFADTLLSTPANYSVVVAMHSAFSGNVSIETEDKFCMSAEYSPDWITQNGAIVQPGDAVADIVNAFIRGDNYSETIEYNTIAPTPCLVILAVRTPA